MSALNPAGDKIVQHLREAVERLQDDVARVELWAGALGCFAKPVPDYDPAQSQINKFMLPSKSKQPQPATQPTGTGDPSRRR